MGILEVMFRWSGVCCLLMLLFGCEKEKCFYDVSFGNKSKVEIFKATIITGNKKHDFGFLGASAATRTYFPTATSLGCGIIFTPNAVIEWEENDKPQRAKIDIMKYEKHKTTIRNFTFYYLGDGKWETIAYKGEPTNRSVVEP
jgi:hypothetical protein